MQGGKKSKALKLRARMLMRTKVSMHVEVVSLLQRLSNTRPKAITLDVEMEDYYRIKGARTNG